MSRLIKLSHIVNPQSCSYEFAEADVRLREEKQNPGVSFARKERSHSGIGKSKLAKDKSEKMIARRMVQEFFGTIPMERGESRHFLTMPGLYWKFERLLSGSRANLYSWHCVEDEIAIYQASFPYMVGFRHAQGISIVSQNTISAFRVAEYVNGKMEDYIEKTENWFDSAWLDFNGPLTIRRLRCIEKLMRICAYCVVVTFEKARDDKDFSSLWVPFEGRAEYLTHAFGIPDMLYEYADPTPMLQIGWKINPFPTETE